jgi:hypothetical protein
MWTMYDSVDIGQIPASAPAVAGYVGGAWPTYESLIHRFPHAKHLSIAVNAGENAECLDIETGDAKVEDAPNWFERQRVRGIWRPCFYISLSNVDALVETLKTHRIGRPEYRLWVAHYTYRAHVCGPAEGISVVADGTQWSDKALGRNLDESLCGDSFFAAAATPRPAQAHVYVNPQEEHWITEWDRIRPRKTLAAHLRRVFLKGQMQSRMRAIKRVAEAEQPDGWGILNRKARYDALAVRTR